MMDIDRMLLLAKRKVRKTVLLAVVLPVDTILKIFSVQK
jgi:hypothetical protein